MSDKLEPIRTARVCDRACFVCFTVYLPIKKTVIQYYRVGYFAGKPVSSIVCQAPISKILVFDLQIYTAGGLRVTGGRIRIEGLVLTPRS